VCTLVLVDTVMAAEFACHWMLEQNAMGKAKHTIGGNAGGRQKIFGEEGFQLLSV
jgi:hypothetical protein